MKTDILSIFVIIFDLLACAFLTWRATAKNATLDRNARIVYGWVILTEFYHAVIYVITMFSLHSDVVIFKFIHPLVVLYMLNAPLIAIIHWRGGRI